MQVTVQFEPAPSQNLRFQKLELRSPDIPQCRSGHVAEDDSGADEGQEDEGNLEAKEDPLGRVFPGDEAAGVLTKVHQEQQEGQTNGDHRHAVRDWYVGLE